MPNTSANIYPHHSPTHSRSFSQPALMPTRETRALARAGVNARVPQADYSRFLQPSHLPTPGVHTPLYAQPAPDLNGTPDLANMEFTRRHSEADVLNVQGMLSPLYPTPNHQPALAMCQSHERSMFSMAPPTSQGLCASFTEAALGPSSGSDGDYFPEQSPTPSGSQDDCAMSLASVPSPDPFSVAEPDATDAPGPLHKDTTPASHWSPSSLRNGENLGDTGAARGLKSPKHGRTSKRHRDPMDPRAAKRLERQRKTDEDNIKILWNLFVPKDEKPPLKKDRLETSTSRRWNCVYLAQLLFTVARYASIWVESYRSLLPQLVSFERRRCAREGSAAQTEAGVSQQQRQLVRQGDHVMGFAKYFDTSELGLDDTAGSTTSGLQKQTVFLTHRPH